MRLNGEVLAIYRTTFRKSHRAHFGSFNVRHPCRWQLQHGRKTIPLSFKTADLSQQTGHGMLCSATGLPPKVLISGLIFSIYRTTFRVSSTTIWVNSANR